MSNRKYDKKNDERTHDTTWRRVNEVLAQVLPGVNIPKLPEKYKKGDAFPSIPGKTPLSIECEMRDAEWTPGKKRNFDQLWNGSYTTLHIPNRKSPKRSDIGYDFYIAFDYFDPSRFIVIDTSMLDLGELEVTNHKIDGVWEEFVNVPAKYLWYVTQQEDGSLEPHSFTNYGRYYTISIGEHDVDVGTLFKNRL